MLRVVCLAIALAVAGAASATAQDRSATLADIRTELTVLYGEIERLRAELGTTGTSGVTVGGVGVSQRVDNIEVELARLTSQIEALQNRIESVVQDGTNRIGDLEFRLCELEPSCDIASLGETPQLGGGPVLPAPSVPDRGGAASGSAELAVGEEQDFRRAQEAFDNGRYDQAADLFQRFTETYQGGPLTGPAHFMRGEALSRLGLDTAAARAYLESFSGSPNSDIAPAALLQLGLSLNRIGQGDEACITLGEVTARFPASPASVEAQTARAQFNCS